MSKLKKIPDGKLMRAYGIVKKEVDDANAAHKLKMEKRTSQLNSLRAEILSRMNENKVTSMKYGTVSASMTKSHKPVIEDIDELSEYVVATGDIGIMQKSPNQTRIKELLLDDEGELKDEDDLSDELKLLYAGVKFITERGVRITVK